jgi:hypothetical protein
MRFCGVHYMFTNATYLKIWTFVTVTMDKASHDTNSLCVTRHRTLLQHTLHPLSPLHRLQQYSLSSAPELSNIVCWSYDEPQQSKGDQRVRRHACWTTDGMFSTKLPHEEDETELLQPNTHTHIYIPHNCQLFRSSLNRFKKQKLAFSWLANTWSLSCGDESLPTALKTHPVPAHYIS